MTLKVKSSIMVARRKSLRTHLIVVIIWDIRYRQWNIIAFGSCEVKYGIRDLFDILVQPRVGKESRSPLPSSNVENCDESKSRHQNECEHENDDDRQRFVVVIEHFRWDDTSVGMREGAFNEAWLNQAVFTAARINKFYLKDAAA